jgi:hypothetical protein
MQQASQVVTQVQNSNSMMNQIEPTSSINHAEAQ